MLQTFKGIAAYTKERYGLEFHHETFRRWAKELGMPVHRASNRIYTRAAEFDPWFESTILRLQ